MTYGILGLICVAAIVFMLVCLRGFHSALRQKQTWALLIKVKEENSPAIAHDAPRLIRFPAWTAKTQRKPDPQKGRYSSG